MNHLICWKEKSEQKWDMVKKKDINSFLLNLLQNPDIDDNSVFIIPANAILSGIWLIPETHSSKRVDFYNFQKEFGVEYQPPKVNELNKKILDRYDDKYGKDTKYGWISPDGRYFHCDYQGHIDLADKICFGLTEEPNSERYLEVHGWCKIFKPLCKKTYSIYIDDKYSITDAQMKTLIALGLDNVDGLSEILSRN